MTIDAPQLPVVVDQSGAAAERRYTLRMPEDLLFFNGHFEQAPILPGVVQIHWAEYFARRDLPLTGDFTQLESIKFHQVIVPGQQVELALEYQREKNKLVFSYRSELGQHSSGRIVFGGSSQ